MKKYMVVPILVLLALFSCSAMAATFTKTFKVVTYSKEKTVLVNEKEIKDLTDFNYTVKNNAQIIEKVEGVYMSYKGNLITGNIKVKASVPALDDSYKNKTNVQVKYFHSKNKKVTSCAFTDCKITDVKTKKKNGKVTEATYSFKAAKLTEKNGQ